MNIFPLNSNLIWMVPCPITSAPVSPMPCNISLTGQNSVNASRMAQTWDVVHEFNNQSYFDDSLGFPAMKHALFKLEFTSSA